MDRGRKIELTYLLGADDLTGAEVALLGGGGDGEDGHDGGEVHAVDHGWEQVGKLGLLLESEHMRCWNWWLSVKKPMGGWGAT